MKTTREDEFERFVRERRTSLVRMATTLTAGDAHLAEDLVQGALTRVYLRGSSKLLNDSSRFAYVRRAIVNGLIDHRRRPFSRRERPTDVLPDSPIDSEGTGDHDDLVTALARLPVGMRAAVVLRHVEGLSVDETADALNCSTGNVKSQTARGLDRLRTLLEGEPACQT